MNNNQTTESLSRRGALRRFGKLAALTSAAVVFGDALQASAPVNPSEIHLDADKVYINNKVWFDTDGHMHIESSNGLWNDLQALPIFSANQSSTPVWTNYAATGIYLNFFNRGDQMFFTVQLPHDWKEGSNIIPHVHWIPKNNMGTTNYVGWQLFYSIAKPGTLFPTSNTEMRAYSASNFAAGSSIAAGSHVISVFKKYNSQTGQYDDDSGISMAGNTISTVLMCRLYRMNDNFSNANDYAGLLSLSFHYERDGLGSSSQFSK